MTNICVERIFSENVINGGVSVFVFVGMIGVTDKKDEDQPDGGATTEATLTINVILIGVRSIFHAISIDRTMIVCTPLMRVVCEFTDTQDI